MDVRMTSIFVFACLRVVFGASIWRDHLQSHSQRSLLGRVVTAGRRSLTTMIVCLCVGWLLTACSPALPGSGPDNHAEACLAGLFGAPGTVTGVFVEPDDARAPVLNELNAAQCSIDIAVYLITDEAIIVALENAAARGVRVRLILAEHPYGGGGQDELAARLRPQGIEFKWSDNEFRFTHAKYILVDRQVALILNLNLTVSAFTNNREFGVVSTNAEAVAEAQHIFDRDWQGDRAATADGPLIVSPVNSRQRYMALIGNARTSIDLYVEVIRDEEVIQGLGKAVQRGVRVRLIVNAPKTDDDRKVVAQLAAEGVEVSVSTGLYIHAKLMVTDDLTAVVGSQNFTPTSLDANREIAMQFTDALPVARCLAIFEADWNAARPALNRVPDILFSSYANVLPLAIPAA